MMKKPTQEEAVAVTWVFWDMNMCPVPAGCDPGVVRGCIKRVLEKNGYGGPLIFTAFGKLGDVSVDMLRGVYSSGIALTNVPQGASDIATLIEPTEDIPSPANFMLISDRNACPGYFQYLQMLEYNPIEPFPYVSLESLILEGESLFEEEEEETGESPLWDCCVCTRDPPGQGFDNFIAHLNSGEHNELMSTHNILFPPSPPVDDASRARKALLLEHLRQNDLLWPKNNFHPPTIERPSGFSVIDWERVKSESETFVFWDINLCPVPPGCDASLVSPCIKRFLKREGCSGPLTITAIGVLTDIPIDILRKVYSSGITLHNVPYGPADTAELISAWSRRNGVPLYNIMVISTAKIYAYKAHSLQFRCNLLKPFPNVSLQSFCLADSGALDKEDECSETGDTAFWVCSVCDNSDTPMQGFESFTTHLSGTNHLQKLSELLPLSYEFQCLSSPLSESAEIKLEAVTGVFWDIKMCPVPFGCDPCRVGPCIKQYLKNKGYSGPLTITAVGVLTDVPFDILRGINSSGITLKNGFLKSSDLVSVFTIEYPPPANIVVISDAKLWKSEYSFQLQLKGYNLVQPFPCDSLESFFLQDSGPIEEDNCSDYAMWICEVCSHDGHGFENFTNHVTSRRHGRELLDWLPWKARMENTPNYCDKGK